jgi:hypothetical protein
MEGMVAALFFGGEQIGLLLYWDLKVTDASGEKWRVKFRYHWIERYEPEAEARLYLDVGDRYYSHTITVPYMDPTEGMVKDELIITGEGGWIAHQG